MFYGKHKVDGSYGFFEKSSDCLNAVELSDEQYDNLFKGQSEGKQIQPDSNGYPVLVEMKDNRTYAEKRASEYPTLGDMIDAFCKAKAGDDSELLSLMEKREKIKQKYPKEDVD